MNTEQKMKDISWQKQFHLSFLNIHEWLATLQIRSTDWELMQ